MDSKNLNAKEMFKAIALIHLTQILHFAQHTHQLVFYLITFRFGVGCSCKALQKNILVLNSKNLVETTPKPIEKLLDILPNHILF
jgi:hypothetical protein